jgi:hypothetical protein
MTKAGKWIDEEMYACNPSLWETGRKLFLFLFLFAVLGFELRASP